MNLIDNLEKKAVKFYVAISIHFHLAHDAPKAT